MMKQITLEVVSNVLTSYGTCGRCDLIFRESGVGEKVNREDIAEYPSDLKEEFVKLSDLVRELSRLYEHRLRIRFIDAKSLLGIYKALVHRFRTYPTFIIEKKDVYTGWERQELEDLIDVRLKDLFH
jgi:hypothetical protein